MGRNDGKGYEDLAERIYRKLSEQSPFSSVERNVRIQTDHGERQIDILLKANSMGIEFRTIVECRNHKKKVDVGYIDSVVSKMKDVKAHKAIIISSSGFTSGARSKARGNDIDLCVAQEALSTSWNIDVEIPVLVFEATPWKIEVNAQFPAAIKADFELVKDQMVINDRDLFRLVQEQWNSGNLVLQSDDAVRKVILTELPPPHFVRDRCGNRIDLSSIQLALGYTVSTYYGNLKEIENTQLLKHINDNKITVLFESAPIKDYKSRFRKLANNEVIAFKTLTFTVKTGLQIDKVIGASINLIKADN